MGKRLYVGNLPYSFKSGDLEEIFQEIGEVVNVKVITDQETGRSKGFAFVEMSSDDLGVEAIEKLNGKEVDGRALKVTEANPRPERPQGGGGGFRGARDQGYSSSRGGAERGNDRGNRERW